MNPVGYLTKYPDRLEGERGQYYDYVQASNGIWIEAEAPLLAARIPVAECEIRGLAPLETKVVLRYGKLPQRCFDLALNWMLTDKYQERYAAVVWNGEYRLVIPKQAAEKETVAGGGDEGHGAEMRVAYENPDQVILDLHSHAKLKAFFSPRDNTDETGFKLYGVLGKMDVKPQVLIRVGVYGYHAELPWEDVFEGHLDGVDDACLEDLVLPDEEEVITEDELHSLAEPQHGSPENRGGRMWWHRWLRGRRALSASGR